MVILTIPAFTGCHSIFNRRVTGVSPNLLDDKLLDNKLLDNKLLDKKI